MSIESWKHEGSWQGQAFLVAVGSDQIYLRTDHQDVVKSLNEKGFSFERSGVGYRHKTSTPKLDAWTIRQWAKEEIDTPPSSDRTLQAEAMMKLEREAALKAMEAPVVDEVAFEADILGQSVNVQRINDAVFLFPTRETAESPKYNGMTVARRAIKTTLGVDATVENIDLMEYAPPDAKSFTAKLRQMFGVKTVREDKRYGRDDIAGIVRGCDFRARRGLYSEEVYVDLSLRPEEETSLRATIENDIARWTDCRPVESRRVDADRILMRYTPSCGAQTFLDRVANLRRDPPPRALHTLQEEKDLLDYLEKEGENENMTALDNIKHDMAMGARIAGGGVALDKLVDVLESQLRANGLPTEYLRAPAGRALAKLAIPSMIRLLLEEPHLKQALPEQVQETLKEVASAATTAATAESTVVLIQMFAPLLTEFASVKDSIGAGSSVPLASIITEEVKTEVE